jgi:RNA polymerase sigma factor (sigma-70 family)
VRYEGVVTGVDGLAGELFERHGRSVRRYLRALTGNGDLAEDLAQEVFLRVLRGADRYQPRGRERAWLFRIARNLALDARRRAAVRPPGGPALEVTVPATQSLSLTLGQALAELPPAEREAFLMVELGGLSYAETGVALELSVAAVRSCLHRARLALRATLPPPPPGGMTATRTDHEHDE